MKEVLIEPEGIYRHTQTRTEVIIPVDYKSLAEGTQSNNEHSAIAESQSLNSYAENNTFAYMAGTSEEMGKRFEEQAQVQKTQHNIL